MQIARFLTGQMLIAMPGIGDPRFDRAIVLICAHDGDHAVGLTVNRPMADLTVPDLLRQLNVGAGDPIPEDLVLLGGPVERERGFVLHTADYDCSDGSTVNFAADLALTTTRPALEAISRHETRPRRCALSLGYAGWGAGQLEHEIRNNVWLVCDADEYLVFGPAHESKWTRALAKLGVVPQRLSAEAGQA